MAPSPRGPEAVQTSNLAAGPGWLGGIAHPPPWASNMAGNSRTKKMEVVSCENHRSNRSKWWMATQEPRGVCYAYQPGILDPHSNFASFVSQGDAQIGGKVWDALFVHVLQDLVFFHHLSMCCRTQWWVSPIAMVDFQRGIPKKMPLFIGNMRVHDWPKSQDTLHPSVSTLTRA